MDPLLGLGFGIASSIFGSSAAKKQARAQREMMRRQAAATYANQMRNLDAQYSMGIENLYFGTQQQLMQEKLNNQTAMANWLHSEKMADMRLKDINAGIAAQNQKNAALERLKREKMVIGHSSKLAMQSIAKSNAERKLRQDSSKAIASASSRAAARGLLPGNPMNNPVKMMTVRDVAQASAEMSAKDDLQRRTATSQLSRDLAMSHIRAQGQKMKRKVQGRPPQLFDSSRMMMYLAGRNASNLMRQTNLGMTNARAARDAMIANANIQYQNARSAANSKMWAGIGGSLFGYAMADLEFGPSIPSDATGGGSGFTALEEHMIAHPTHYEF